MTTVRKNATRQLARLREELTECRVFSLSNGFRAQPCDPACAWKSLWTGPHAKLTTRGDGVYVVHVHSNLWYELRAPAQVEAPETTGARPDGSPVTPPRQRPAGQLRAAEPEKIMSSIVNVNDMVIFRAGRWQVVRVAPQVQEADYAAPRRPDRLRLWRSATGEAVWADADKVMPTGERAAGRMKSALDLARTEVAMREQQQEATP